MHESETLKVNLLLLLFPRFNVPHTQQVPSVCLIGKEFSKENSQNVYHYGAAYSLVLRLYFGLRTFIFYELYNNVLKNDVISLCVFNKEFFVFVFI